MNATEHTPTAAQFRKLVAWMRNNIEEGYVFDMESCFACVAGKIGKIAVDKMPPLMREYAACGDNNDFIFRTGTRTVANMLGFDSGEQLERWADEHSDIWGNSHGDAMFSSFTDSYHPDGTNDHLWARKVYNFTAEEAEQLGSIDRDKVIAHLEGVAERLEAQERKPAPDFDFSQWLRETPAPVPQE